VQRGYTAGPAASLIARCLAAACNDPSFDEAAPAGPRAASPAAGAARMPGRKRHEHTMQDACPPAGARLPSESLEPGVCPRTLSGENAPGWVIRAQCDGALHGGVRQAAFVARAEKFHLPVEHEVDAHRDDGQEEQGKDECPERPAALAPPRPMGVRRIRCAPDCRSGVCIVHGLLPCPLPGRKRLPMVDRAL